MTKRLAAEFEHVSRDSLKGATFGERGAAFHAIWMAKPEQLGFLTSNLFWSWKGYVIRSLAPCDSDVETSAFLDLSPAEKIVYLKYYLEGDGAILISLARELVSREVLTEDDLVQTDLLERCLQGIWQEYLDLSTNISDRVRLRHKLLRQKYDKSTRRHKTYPHLIPLEDMGLVTRERVNGRDVFCPATSDGMTPLQIMVEAFQTIRELEDSIDRSEHCSILSCMLFPSQRRFSQQQDLAILMRTVMEIYRVLRSNGIAIHPIDAITDICYAQMLYRQQILVTRRDIDGALADLQTRHPKEVRFHVDRLGRPAYIVVDDGLVDSFLSA